MTFPEEQFVYLTTIGRKTGALREIEIWYVEHDSRLYILAEHGYKAHWVRNILANPSVTVRLAKTKWKGTARVVEADTDAAFFAQVRELARKKYAWGDGLPVEIRLDREIQD